MDYKKVAIVVLIAAPILADLAGRFGQTATVASAPDIAASNAADTPVVAAAAPPSPTAVAPNTAGVAAANPVLPSLAGFDPKPTLDPNPQPPQSFAQPPVPAPPVFAAAAPSSPTPALASTPDVNDAPPPPANLRGPRAQAF